MSAEQFSPGSGLGSEHGDRVKWEDDGAPEIRDAFNDDYGPNPGVLTELNETNNNE